MSLKKNNTHLTKQIKHYCRESELQLLLFVLLSSRPSPHRHQDQMQSQASDVAWCPWITIKQWKRWIPQLFQLLLLYEVHGRLKESARWGDISMTVWTNKERLYVATTWTDWWPESDPVPNSRFPWNKRHRLGRKAGELRTHAWSHAGASFLNLTCLWIKINVVMSCNKTNKTPWLWDFTDFIMTIVALIIQPTTLYSIFSVELWGILCIFWHLKKIRYIRSAGTNVCSDKWDLSFLFWFNDTQ